MSEPQGTVVPRTEALSRFQQGVTMTVDERSRHALYLRLEEILGVEEAAVLMEHLPPVGWSDVATKHDLDALESRLVGRIERTDDRIATLDVRFDARLEATEQRILATLRAEMSSQTRAMVFAMSAAMVSVAGLALAAARLT